MPTTNQWGANTPGPTPEETREELMQRMLQQMQEEKLRLEETGASLEGNVRDRLSNAWTDLTQPSQGDINSQKVDEFLEYMRGGEPTPEPGLMDQLGATWDKAKKRTSRAVETLTAPEPQSLMDAITPEGPGMRERVGDFMNNANDYANSLMNPQEPERINLEGRRPGDVWVEGDRLFHLTKDGLQERSVK
jgi:hypothetical protein